MNLRKFGPIIFIAFITVFAGSCGLLNFTQKNPPFALDRRPQPTGDNLDELLPVKIGEFEREEFSKAITLPDGEDIQVLYQAGEESVYVGFCLTRSEKDAREAVKVTRREALNEKIKPEIEYYAAGSDPSYFKTKTFMSWSRGKYFFYVVAATPERLEEFMKAFPY
jgi:hypothetical protein